MEKLLKLINEYHYNSSEVCKYLYNELYIGEQIEQLKNYELDQKYVLYVEKKQE